MCNVLNEDTMTCDYGVSKVLSKDSSVRVVHPKQQQQQPSSVHRQNTRKVGVMGSRRIFPPSFKLKVLYSYRHDVDCRGNQRATARKYGIHRRQIQKWLQCEENLKSCAENGNTRPSSTSTTDSSASVSKADSATATEAAAAGPAAGAAAIPAASALNLNVARLHGDELTTQQRSSPPPASPPHLPLCGASPPAQHRTVPQSALLQSMVRYSPYSPPSDQHHRHHRETESTVHTQDIHFMDAQVDQNRNYGDESTTADAAEAMSQLGSDRNKIAPQEKIKGYYWPSTLRHPHHMTDIDASNQHRHRSPNFCSRGNVDLPTTHGQLNMYGLIGAPLIKTEPASPDSAATSGPYESAGSPGHQLIRSPGHLEPLTMSDQVATDGSSAHFSSATPSLSDVHVHKRALMQPHVHDHTHAHVYEPSHLRPFVRTGVTPPDFYLHHLKRESVQTTGYTEEEGEHASAHTRLVPGDSYSPRLHQRERESEKTMTTDFAEGEGGQKEKARYCETVIKEEVDLGEMVEDESYDDDDDDERQENNSSPYIDVTGDQSIDSLESPESAAVKVEVDDHSKSSTGYPASSSRSSGTLSDSDMGSLDGSPGNQNSPTNLIRRQQHRRSFPLNFKLDVLNAFHMDADVAGNQRATARKFDINRRQVQKWLLKESDLRVEVALRRDSRQQLAPVPEAFAESPIDLRTVHCVPSDYSRPSSEGADPEAECGQSLSNFRYYEFLPDTPFCSTVRPPFYLGNETNEVEPVEHFYMRHGFVERRATTSTTSSNQDLSLQGSDAESPFQVHCHSPKDSPEPYDLPEEQPSALKRPAYSWDNAPSPKRFCPDETAPQQVPSQDRPLCLVKPKKAWLMASRMEELVRSTLSESSDTSQPSSSTMTANVDDGILFKPYLDNPVCRPASNDVVIQRDLSPTIRENIINNNQTSADSGINDNDISYYRYICNTNQNSSIQMNLLGLLDTAQRLGAYRVGAHL